MLAIEKPVMFKFIRAFWASLRKKTLFILFIFIFVLLLSFVAGYLINRPKTSSLVVMRERFYTATEYAQRYPMQNFTGIDLSVESSSSEVYINGTITKIDVKNREIHLKFILTPSYKKLMLEKYNKVVDNRSDGVILHLTDDSRIFVADKDVYVPFSSLTSVRNDLVVTYEHKYVGVDTNVLSNGDLQVKKLIWASIP